MTATPKESTGGLPFDNSPYILAVYKPRGISSFDCIRALKRSLFSILGKGKGRRKLKIGHFGTLDPFAEGVLLVGTGKALKLMKFFQEDMVKVYEGVGSLKFSTDTGDCDGALLKESEELEVGEEDISHALKSFEGEYLQRPPYFSAVKHQGRPLYEWAREGHFIDKEPVRRFVHRCEFLKSEDQQYRFLCQVSSGTYIRGLWSDVAHQMGYFGHLTSLIRTHWGDIEVKDCIKLSELDDSEALGAKVREGLKRPDKLWKLPSLILEDANATKFRQGQFLFLNDALKDDQIPEDWQSLGWVYSREGTLLGLGVIENEGGAPYLKVSVSLVES